ncbi:HEAT repeat domain-containing protein [Paenibacillus massiliensis]|uniref:HEAT repeat domain-containing protein n=1 Tax=Paenibacillus massiliensis TaxID=225917 RepID=UPI001E630658|nr:HEAT repeat domain-containing protein [Paenibacillus massiliensis]
MDVLKDGNIVEVDASELAGMTNQEWEQRGLHTEESRLRPLSSEEITEMVSVLQGMTGFEELLPLWTNDHSDYIGVYASGILRGKVCHISHEETDLSPGFRSVETFFTAVQQYPEQDWEELTKDYPTRQELSEQEEVEDIQCLSGLLLQIEREETDEEERCMLLYSVMALTPISRLDSLLPYLDDEDMYVQERACDVLGHHRYVPAKEKLEVVAKQGMHNGKSAAARALSRIRQQEWQDRQA